MTFYFQCAYINYLVSVGCFFCKFFLESRINHLKIKIQSNIYVYIYISHRITNYKITPHEGVQWRNNAFLNLCPIPVVNWFQLFFLNQTMKKFLSKLFYIFPFSILIFICEL